MTVSPSQVKELRAATGAGMMDCKRALQEADGDMEAARDFLRKKGISIARKKSSRETNEGGIGIVAAGDGKTAGMVQLACETDFVARNDQFGALLHHLAAQTLTGGPENLKEQALEAGPGTVNDLIVEAIGKMGENLQLVNASRIAVDGEGTLGEYVHTNMKIGVLVALGSAKAIPASDLESLANDLAMHIAASQVSAIHGDDIDPAVIAKEKEIYAGQAKESGKPENIIEKIVQGRLDKFVNEVSLMNQPFVKDPDNTVGQLLAGMGKELGAELTVQRFEKFQF